MKAFPERMLLNPERDAASQETGSQTKGGPRSRIGDIPNRGPPSGKVSWLAIINENQKAVKKLIRNRRTKQFLTETGQWTSDLSRAWVAPSGVSPLEQTRKLNIVGVVEIYYSFSDCFEFSPWDFAISLDPLDRATTPDKLEEAPISANMRLKRLLERSEISGGHRIF